MKQREKTGGKRFLKWIEKGDLPNRGGGIHRHLQSDV